KQEVEEVVEILSSDDEDFNVGALLDNLRLLKSEVKMEDEQGVAVKQEVAVAVKQEVEVEVEVEREVEAVQSEEQQQQPPPALTPVAVKSKSQGKRVTWNIQEPDGPQPEKSASKLALYKLKLKQEGARRPASSAKVPGSSSSSKRRGGASGSASAPPASGGVAPEDQGDPKDGELPRNDEYQKKLHMQERAVEEVKLAIKPYYQGRDITKEEYKEIVRKAVQKVCHSKSGAINPAKVAILVKAYVDKYKHMRKHLTKPGDEGAEGAAAAAQNPDDTKDSASP
ncbi:hypothetical protein CRUP_006659, partial [Coryphaenoides rupestris]